MKLNLHSILTAFVCVFFSLLLNNTQAQWQSYTPVLSDTVGVYDFRIAQEDDSVAWAIAMKYDNNLSWVPTDSLFFMKTADGGNTWSGGTIPMGAEPYASSISCISASTAWASGLDFDFVSYVLRTRDGGLTWERQLEDGFVEASSYVNIVHFWDEANGVAIGDPAVSSTQSSKFFEIYTTTDSGNNWTRVNPANIPVPLQNEAGYGGRYFVIGNHIWFPTFNYNTGNFVRLFKSTDRGATWVVYNEQVANIYFADTLHGISRAYNAPDNILRYTDDGGATWTTLPAISGQFLTSVVLIPQSYYLLAVFRTNDNVGPFQTKISTDLGTTWNEIGDGTQWVTHAQFRSPSLGYGGEFYPISRATRMYKYNGSPLTGLFSGETLTARVDIAPNPVSDRFQVQIHSDQPTEFVLLLNDLQGRLITRQHLEKAAQGQTEFDLSNLPAGLYTLTISSEKGYVTKKVVKR